MKTKHDEVYKLEQEEVEHEEVQPYSQEVEEEKIQSDLSKPPCYEVESNERTEPYYGKEEIFELEDNLPKLGFLLEDPLAWAFIDVQSPTCRIPLN